LMEPLPREGRTADEVIALKTAGKNGAPGW
jgi:hypothetical protein